MLLDSTTLIIDVDIWRLEVVWVVVLALAVDNCKRPYRSRTSVPGHPVIRSTLTLTTIVFLPGPPPTRLAVSRHDISHPPYIKMATDCKAQLCLDLAMVNGRINSSLRRNFAPLTLTNYIECGTKAAPMPVSPNGYLNILEQIFKSSASDTHNLFARFRSRSAFNYTPYHRIWIAAACLLNQDILPFKPVNQ
ncbi:hypothetical protein D9613_012547 [Agrocybe pediades]|uniref:Uncharacterized protein n=1 Tax=Agrocybe pediades TaxID=84607 RepID=A0A8H4QRI3_9AGAR|nr:hypothetical protein D9613_012547 [Agrocybe pediades]